MGHLRAAPGERILDVGCGTGGTAAELAAMVAPAGQVTGIDLAPSMAQAARARFAAVANVRFAACDIETADRIPGAPFDAAYARMVLMLLADPVAGCASIRRSLRPGGRLAATVFRDAAASPWLPAALLGAAPHLGPLPQLPIGDEPGPFAFADPARPRKALTAAGFTDIGVRPVDTVLRTPDDPDKLAGWLIEIGPAGAAYRAAHPAQQAAARHGTAALLRRFRTPGTGYQLPAGIWLLTATCPAAAPGRRGAPVRESTTRNTVASGPATPS